VQSVPFEVADWNIKGNPYSPQQDNGYDCGMYVVMCVDFLCDNIPLTIKRGEHLAISSRNMPYFRMKVAADILRGFLYY